MSHLIFLKPCLCAKQRPRACPNCATPIARRDAASIAYLAACYGTTTAHCLRCTLEEFELIEDALYLDPPPPACPAQPPDGVGARVALTAGRR